MSAQLELVELSRDASDTVLRFSLPEGDTITVSIQAIARSPHLYNIVAAAESEEGTQSICVPRGFMYAWLQHISQSDDQSIAALSRSSAEDLMVLLKACDFFADERGIRNVSRQLGSRLFKPSDTHQQTDGDSGSASASLMAEKATDAACKSKQAVSGPFWSSAWNTCWTSNPPIGERKQISVSSACKALEVLPTPLAIAIIKASKASLGKCLQQIPERHHPVVLLAHFPSIEQADALSIERATLQNEFTAHTLQCLFDASLKFPTISTLDVNINNVFTHAHMLITEEVSQSFQRVLCRFTLTSLSVNGDLLTDPVIAAIADVLPRQHQLRRVVLARNRWHTPVFSLSARLFDALQKCRDLQHLELTEFRGEDCMSSWEVLHSPIAAALLAMSRLETLSLTRKSITPSDLLAIHAKAEQHECPGTALLPNLRSIDLSFNQLGASGARALAPVLSCLSSLQHLKLAMNGCGAPIHTPVLSTRRRASGELAGDGLEALAPVFSSLTSLRYLDVSGNPYLSNQGAAALCTTWQVLRNLQHLDMSNCHAFPKGSISMCSVVSQFTRLSYLDFTSFSLVDGQGSCAGARALADSLLCHSNLQHLILASTQLTADAITVLAPSISTHPQLQALDLQYNTEIGSRGVIVLSQNLSPLSNLHTLAIACLDASDEAAAALAAALPGLRALETLNLCHFRTSTDGTEFLTDAFARLLRLEQLLLADFGHCPASGIARAVRSMASLKKLNLGSNPVGDAECRALADSLQSATTLEWLNLSAHVNICSKAALVAFVGALDSHPSLRTCILSVADYLELPEDLRKPWVRLN